MDNPLGTIRRIPGFCAKEDGMMTVYGLFTCAALLVLGGYALDVSNVMTSRTELQMAADSVAHAALVEREFKSAADSRTTALSLSDANLPTAEVGRIVREGDIVFGDWDADTKTFVAREASRSAVEVTAWQHSAKENAVATYMLKIVGVDKWDVKVKATYVTYIPSCLREGFVAEDVVDLQSNNSYSNGFCIHSNTHVSLNSNNYFEPGTVVSMTSLADLELPNSGMSSNEGLSAALREGSWNIRILKRISSIIAGIQDSTSRYYPDYITSATPIVLRDRTVDQDELTAGRIHTFRCTGGASLTISNGVNVNKAVIVTDCKIKFGSGVVLTNAVIATTNSSAQSITSAAGVQVGLDDNCAIGGGAQLITMGSMSFPADLKMYGGQLLAVHDIEFAANANGIEGAAMVAGGKISGTSNMAMGFCGTGMEDNFQADYFKLVN